MTDDGGDGRRDGDATERRLRLRALLADNREVVALALLALVVTGAWLAGTAYVAPGTASEERVAASWERTSEFSHAATVTRSVGAFDDGQRLANRSVYFSRAAPVLDVRYAVGYAATAGGSLDVDVRLRLVRRALAGEEGDGGGGGVLWRTERVLATRNVTGLAPGGSVAVPASVNATSVAARTDELVSELGASPGTTEVALVADVRLDGRVNGRETERAFTHEVGLAVADATYRVTGQPRSSSREETTRPVEVERTYGPLYRVGGPLLLGVGLVGLAGLRTERARSALDVDAAERDWLAYRDERSEYDEWVHAVDLPPEAEDLPRAHARSLGDLVDLAIDVDAAVLESSDGGTYRVVHDGYRYVYEAPPAPGAWTWRAAEHGTETAPPDATEAEEAAAATTGTAEDAPSDSGDDDADGGRDAGGAATPGARTDGRPVGERDDADDGEGDVAGEDGSGETDAGEDGSGETDAGGGSWYDLRDWREGGDR